MSRPMIVVACLAIGVNAASARVIPNWPYDKLVREADMIVIAMAVGSMDTADVPASDAFKAELIGKETKFSVRAVLKGKLEGESLTLLHFRLKGLMPPNGPMLISFQISDKARPSPEYLLFLKRRTDGRFEPVAGQVDSVLSVRQIDGALGR